MPMTDDPRWSCFRKKTYPGEKAAKAVARNVRLTRGVEVHAYSCPTCLSWHIGSGRAWESV